ncbi:hypothetical protein OU789_12385 [Halocynthiibacter sp. C4]|uniref:hypothetical protein n=1 Tax=Halocynthiibacter sp. C4 TaxID=2992758 RepID=UPI00237BAACC|nr:hypothetical protein [Halocynthiibacter sp. C4]MDE0590726.1 hypothetical protein [Halocynthiibacter sp. C4]
MDADLFFVIGLGVGVLTVPPILGAMFDGRSPRTAAIMVLISGGMIALASSQKPGGYTINEIPEVVSRVVNKYIG